MKFLQTPKIFQKLFENDQELVKIIENKLHFQIACNKEQVNEIDEDDLFSYAAEGDYKDCLFTLLIEGSGSAFHLWGKEGE
eukprot:Awhi_evm1s13251